MPDLRLADEVISASEYISRNENTDVEILSADGSRSIYVKGEEVAPVWFAAPMPLAKPGRAPASLNMTPQRVRFGRWHDELGEFIPSNTFSVEAFLQVYKSSVHTKPNR